MKMNDLKNIITGFNSKPYLTIFLLFILLTGIKVNAQEVRVRSVIDSSYIIIGDQINVKLEIEQPDNYKINFPLIKDSLTKNIEVIELSPIDTIILVSKRLRLEQNILITSFDTGFYVIPSFSFIDILKADTFRTNELALEVLTIEIDTSKGITDIKLPYEAPLTFKELLPYIIAGLIHIGLIFVIIWFIRKSKNKDPLTGRPVKPIDPPHVIAYRELDKLKERKLWQQSKIKLYYSILTEIIRIYIEQRYAIGAMEETTEEILDDLRKKGYENEEYFIRLRQILILADLVKFAKWHPLPDENQSSMDNAYYFIDITKKIIPFNDAPRKENTVTNETENNANKTES